MLNDAFCWRKSPHIQHLATAQHNNHRAQQDNQSGDGTMHDIYTYDHQGTCTSKKSQK